MQMRITRSRLAGEPADVLVRPRLAQFAVMDFHRADKAIAEGERATEEVLRELRALLTVHGVKLPESSLPQPAQLPPAPPV
jgi:NTE family protein